LLGLAWIAHAAQLRLPSAMMQQTTEKSVVMHKERKKERKKEKSTLDVVVEKNNIRSLKWCKHDTPVVCLRWT
jgi:hypothetical protein